MVVPIVAAFAAGAGGVAALGAAATIAGVAGTIATVAAYATIAGAVLTGVGALTKSKDLMKIGAVLSIGGGLATWGATAAAGASAASGASAAESAAANGQWDAVGGITAEEAANMAGAVSSPVAGGTATVVPTTPNTVVAPELPAPAPPTLGTEATAAPPTPIELGQLPDPNTTSNATATAGGTSGVQPQPSVMDSALSRVQDAAKGLNAPDLNAWWEKAKAAGGAVGSFMKDNPALVKIGGEMLSSMYGPQAEKMDFEKSIYNRQQARLNSPIRLTYTKPGG